MQDECCSAVATKSGIVTSFAGGAVLPIPVPAFGTFVEFSRPGGSRNTRSIASSSGDEGNRAFCDRLACLFCH